ncbi:hypothetical protein SAMN05446635_0453 [Burkholderia sp. OK233]|nr:hypothetical protein SAMN05446635_0453 [Burkholderia sp. OK233]
MMGLLRTLSFFARRKMHRLPEVSFETRPTDVGSPALVNQVWEVAICNATGEKVGEAEYGLSPRTDQVYVHRLEILAPVRRHGYGLAFLLMLHRNYHLPVTPIAETHDAGPFWGTVRKLQPGGLVVMSSLSRADWLDERARWRCLQAELPGSSNASPADQDVGKP